MRDFESLENYVDYVLGTPLLLWRPPKGANHFFHNDHKGVEGGSLFGLVIDRQGSFQTELFFVAPELDKITLHTHPDVDSYEMHIAGDFNFIINGESFRNDSDGRALMDRKTLQAVPSSAVHGGTFPKGGSFLSIQQWNNNIKPTTVGDNFEVRPGG